MWLFRVRGAGLPRCVARGGLLTVKRMVRGHLRLITSSDLGVRGPLRILLVDDHRAIRHGLAALLGDYVGVEVAQEQVDGDSILRRIRAWNPDVVFLAVKSSGRSGMDLVAHLHDEAPDTPIVVLTMQRSRGLMRVALERGARGVVLKDHADSELMPAARAAVGGRSYISPLITG